MHHLIDPITGQKLPGIGTPRLYAEGGGKAYFVPSPSAGEPGRADGIWYLFEAGQFENPTGEYRTVRLAEFFSYEVGVEARIIGEGSEEYGAPDWDDTFWVEARDEDEAKKLTYQKVAEFVAHQMSDAEGFEISSYHVRKVY
jgi:hypothetical protein